MGSRHPDTPLALCAVLGVLACVTGAVWVQGADRQPVQTGAQAEQVVLSVTARMEHAPLREVSGIARSRTRPGVYWVHNDSGDRPRIFAIDAEGQDLIPTFSRFSYHGANSEQGKRPWPGFKVLYAENVDWEDIAADENYLYLADTGNNGNARRDLGIYMISEIDPTASTQSAVIKHLPVRYPEQSRFPGEQWHFDSESLFVDQGRLYLITKHRPAGKRFSREAGANLYRLDTAYSDRDNLLTRVDSHPALTSATGAELSPDGKRLAVVSYEALWLFERPARGDRWLSSDHTIIGLDPDTVRQVEAVTWEDDNTVLLTNEQREMFRLSVPASPRGG